MRVHCLQHVPYEGVGRVRDWVGSRGHELSGTQMWTWADGATAPVSGAVSAAGATPPAGATVLPDPGDMDLLVVMGGPMNVYEDREYPWLPAEKAFIAACIARGAAVLGICLGAQLIAVALGGDVTRAPHTEIGWLPVELTEAGRRLPGFAHFPPRFTTLQWHGDTFSIPPGAVHAASSEAVPHQALAYDGGRVMGLQFHLEETPESLAELVAACGADLPAPGRWISTEEELLSPNAPYDACGELLFGLLDSMTARPSPAPHDRPIPDRTTTKQRELP
jgi:GMP synthase-like glutamine amidotransferase